MYVWGHSYEFNDANNWEVIEEFCEYMGGREDIWYATNIEIIDYMDAAKALKFSGNNELVYNPSAISVWLNVDDKKMVEVKGGTPEDMASMLVEGAPDLPMYPISMIIGDNAEMKASVIKSSYVDFKNIEIATKRAQNNMTKFFYNPIPLDETTRWLFPNLKTLYIYSSKDNKFENDENIIARKYIFKYDMLYLHQYLFLNICLAKFFDNVNTYLINSISYYYHK